MAQGPKVLSIFHSKSVIPECVFSPDQKGGYLEKRDLFDLKKLPGNVFQQDKLCLVQKNYQTAGRNEEPCRILWN